MILRFQADADLHQIILHAVIRRAPTLDFQTAAAAGLTGLRDPEVLALATREGRVLVTHEFFDRTGTECLSGSLCNALALQGAQGLSG